MSNYFNVKRAGAVALAAGFAVTGSQIVSPEASIMAAPAAEAAEAVRSSAVNVAVQQVPENDLRARVWYQVGDVDKSTGKIGIDMYVVLPQCNWDSFSKEWEPTWFSDSPTGGSNKGSYSGGYLTISGHMSKQNGEQLHTSDLQKIVSSGVFNGSRHAKYQPDMDHFGFGAGNSLNEAGNRFAMDFRHENTYSQSTGKLIEKTTEANVRSFIDKSGGEYEMSWKCVSGQRFGITVKNAYILNKIDETLVLNLRGSSEASANITVIDGKAEYRNPRIVTSVVEGNGGTKSSNGGLVLDPKVLYETTAQKAANKFSNHTLTVQAGKSVSKVVSPSTLTERPVYSIANKPAWLNIDAEGKVTASPSINETAGKKGPYTVTAKFADGSSSTFTVQVNVTAGAHNLLYKPVPKTQTVELNSTPSAQNSVNNVAEMPEGTTYTWSTAPDTRTVGNSSAVVLVTFPDKTTVNLPVTVNVVDSRKDNQKFPLQVKNISTELNKVPSASAAVTNSSTHPKGTVYSWKTAPNVSTAGSVTATVVAKYPDGSTNEKPVNIDVIDSRKDNQKFPLDVKNIDTELGKVPNASAAVTNASTHPKGTTYTWKSAPVVSSPGTVKATVVATYPDKSVNEKTVSVTVKDTRPDNVKYPLTVRNISAEINKVPGADSAVVNKSSHPEGTTYKWKQTPDVSKEGPVAGVVVATYPDKSTNEKSLTITVGDNRDYTKYSPEYDRTSVQQGEKASTKVKEKNGKPFPKGTTFTLSDNAPTGTTIDKDTGELSFAPSLDTPAATYTGSVIVTYPDTTTSTAGFILAVTEAPAPPVKDEDPEVTVPDNTKYPLKVRDISTDPNTYPDAYAAVTNADTHPEGTSYSWKEAPDTSKPGKYPSTVVAIYPDGSTNEKPITLTVRSYADIFDPIVRPIETTPGNVPPARDAIVNIDDLPEGVQIDWKIPPDTSKPGDTEGTAVITYPDGSTDEVRVPVTVKDNVTDANKYSPRIVDINTRVGQVPEASRAVDNLAQLPKGTVVEWVTQPDVATPGTRVGRVVVKYPDGSSKEFDVNVHVGNDAGDFEPEIVWVNTPVGHVPDPREAIGNLQDLPKGTIVSWIEEPEVSVPSITTGKVRVTYPDGSFEDFNVPVKVGNDADVYTPIVREIDTEKGVLPEAGMFVTNLDTLPEGTTVTWESLPDVDSIGKHTGTIRVTYPDGSFEIVEVTVNVIEKTVARVLASTGASVEMLGMLSLLALLGAAATVMRRKTN